MKYFLYLLFILLIYSKCFVFYAWYFVLLLHYKIMVLKIMLMKHKLCALKAYFILVSIITYILLFHEYIYFIKICFLK